MEISGPLHLMPRYRPPPTFETFSRLGQNADRIPRAFPATFPAAIPATPKQRIQNLSRPQPAHAASPQKTLNTNPWKLTREFDDIVTAYQQPEPQPNEQQVIINPQPVQSPTQQTSDVTMANQKHVTVSIGYDPNYGRQQDVGLAARRRQDSPAGSDAAASHTIPRDGEGWKKDQAIVHIQEETNSAAAPPPPAQAPVYHADWLTTGAHDITDEEFYDRDADAGSTRDSETDNEMYAYEFRSVHQTAAYPHAAAAAAPVGSGPTISTAPTTTPTTSQPSSDEFERPRQVPYDHRKTRTVVKEDIDFFLAVLGGRDPPSATAETQTIVSEEQAVRRRSQEAMVEESSLRRQAETEDTQSDLEFWMSLMQKA